MKPIGIVLVIVAVSTSNVFFRSPTIDGALVLLKGMIGLGGQEQAQVFFDRLGPSADWLQSIGVATGGHAMTMMMIWILILFFVVLFCPNTIEMLARYEPALGVKPPPSTQISIGAAIEWNASFLWAIAVSFLAVVAIISIRGPSEFLYWQF